MIADLTEDLAAEQKARLTYDNILRLSDDPDVNDAIKFLRAREIVHFQRFGEGLRLAKDRLNEKNVYFMNPSLINSAAIISCPRLCRGQLIVRHPQVSPGDVHLRHECTKYVQDPVRLIVVGTQRPPIHIRAVGGYQYFGRITVRVGLYHHRRMLEYIPTEP